ncbi:hypothetical protein SAICODRAFT_73947 [Saitoella complicata NRRL Y-17804]|nr:uncharacterized protein SAICODRAFT_73947 [Saitoella complicata NRRL Y-17804]ODQ49790.1 hypothetical protein SAICODRAFT_73947 [Saitoella complicata NRRL Y-17804]
MMNFNALLSTAVDWYNNLSNKSAQKTSASFTTEDPAGQENQHLYEQVISDFTETLFDFEGASSFTPSTFSNIDDILEAYRPGASAANSLDYGSVTVNSSVLSTMPVVAPIVPSHASGLPTPASNTAAEAHVRRESTSSLTSTTTQSQTSIGSTLPSSSRAPEAVTPVFPSGKPVAARSPSVKYCPAPNLRENLRKAMAVGKEDQAAPAPVQESVRPAVTPAEVRPTPTPQVSSPVVPQHLVNKHLAVGSEVNTLTPPASKSEARNVFDHAARYESRSFGAGVPQGQRPRNNWTPALKAPAEGLKSTHQPVTLLSAGIQEILKKETDKEITMIPPNAKARLVRKPITELTTNDMRSGSFCVPMLRLFVRLLTGQELFDVSERKRDRAKLLPLACQMYCDHYRHDPGRADEIEKCRHRDYQVAPQKKKKAEEPTPAPCPPRPPSASPVHRVMVGTGANAVSASVPVALKRKAEQMEPLGSPHPSKRPMSEAVVVDMEVGMSDAPEHLPAAPNSPFLKPHDGYPLPSAPHRSQTHEAGRVNQTLQKRPFDKVGEAFASYLPSKRQRLEETGRLPPAPEPQHQLLSQTMARSYPTGQSYYEQQSINCNQFAGGHLVSGQSMGGNHYLGYPYRALGNVSSAGHFWRELQQASPSPPHPHGAGPRVIWQGSEENMRQDVRNAWSREQGG